jgi:hypothetical protein
MAPMHSDHLIYGLAFIARPLKGWAGWTDADLTAMGRRYRVFAPICPEPEIGPTVQMDELSPDDVVRFVAPQLLGRLNEQVHFRSVAQLIHEMPSDFWHRFTYRWGTFVDSERCSNDPEAKMRIEQLAARRIAQKLWKIPEANRRRALFQLTANTRCGLQVGQRAKEMLSRDHY